MIIVIANSRINYIFLVCCRASLSNHNDEQKAGMPGDALTAYAMMSPHHSVAIRGVDLSALLVSRALVWMRGKYSASSGAQKIIAERPKI